MDCYNGKFVYIDMPQVRLVTIDSLFQEKPGGAIHVLEKKLALHETMEFHEVINFMTTSLLKSKLSQGVVFDDDLRALLDKNVKLSTPALTAMVKLYSKSELEY